MTTKKVRVVSYRNRTPGENEPAIAIYQGHHVTEIAAKLAGK